VHLLSEYALEHAGIVCVPTLVASERVLSGDLRMVLADYPLSSFWLSVFYPANLRSSLKLKLFLEGLGASFSGVPPWDDALVKSGFLADDVIE
jgi:DNA-binding transcriptional LysR family regulator